MDEATIFFLMKTIFKKLVFYSLVSIFVQKGVTYGVGVLV